MKPTIFPDDSAALTRFGPVPRAVGRRLDPALNAFGWRGAGPLARVAGLALVAAASVALQAAVIDDMCPPVKFAPGLNRMDFLTAELVDCQLVFSGQFGAPSDNANPYANLDNIYWPASLPGTDLSGHTLEVRLDLVRVSQDDVFLELAVEQTGSGGYVLFFDGNELGLFKFAPQGNTLFFWEDVAGVTENVTVVLALTKLEDQNELRLNVRLEDAGRPGGVLYTSPTFVDGPGSDAPAPQSPPKGLSILGPDPGGAFTRFHIVAAGVWHYSIGEPSPLEVVVDNLEYDLFDAPMAVIGNSVMVTALGNAAEEIIPVFADSPESSVWTPLPEPVYDRRGEPRVATLTEGTQRFIRWVPGSQFIDGFDTPKPPYVSRGEWVPGYYDPADNGRWALTVSDGVLRIKTLQVPVEPRGQLPVRPPGPDLQVRDFYASVDILDLRVLHETAPLGIGARVGGDPGNWPGSNNGYIGSVAPNRRGVNLANLTFFPGIWPPILSDPFTFKPGTPYRLVFTGVGQRFSVQLIDLESGQQAVNPLEVTDSTFSQGLVGLWIASGGPVDYDVTLDNFFVTGTKH